MSNELAPAIHNDNGRLTRQESMFLDAIMLDPDDPVRCAELAGFQNPESAVWRLLASPNIKRALYARRQSLLDSVIAISAIRVMKTMLDDKSVPAGTKAKLVKDALDAARHVGLAATKVTHSDDDQNTIDLASMTDEELQGLTHLVEQAKSEVETRRKMPDKDLVDSGLVRL